MLLECSIMLLLLHTDVVRAIADYGFVTSPYPIILSIENHCSLEQQKLLANIFVEILKDKLEYPKGEIEAGDLPSPDQLKYKVLIKGKRQQESKEAADEPDDDDEQDEVDEGGPNPISSAKSRSSSISSKKKKKIEDKAKTVHPDLSRLVYLGTGKVKSLTDRAHSKSIPVDMMASYSEGTTSKNCKQPDVVSGWIEHNKRHLRCGCVCCLMSDQPPACMH
jgi:phosphatidylinositol phospholipase C delta